MDQYVPQIYYWNGIYFLLVWFAVLWLVAQIGGWQELSKQYPLGELDTDEITWKGWQYGRFNNAMWYKGCLWVGISSAGLFLKTGPDLLFRFAHPPLFIPWNRITVGQPYRFLWRKMQRIQIEGISFPLGLPEALVQNAFPPS